MNEINYIRTCFFLCLFCFTASLCDATPSGSSDGNANGNTEYKNAEPENAEDENSIRNFLGHPPAEIASDMREQPLGQVLKFFNINFVIPEDLINLPVTFFYRAGPDEMWESLKAHLEQEHGLEFIANNRVCVVRTRR